MNLSDADLQRFQKLESMLKDGNIPSYRELGQIWDVSSPRTVSKKLDKFKREGLIDWIAGKSKTLSLVKYNRELSDQEIIKAVIRIWNANLSIESEFPLDMQDWATEFINKRFFGSKELRQYENLSPAIIQEEINAFRRSKKTRKCMFKECPSEAVGNDRMCAYHKRAAESYYL